MSGKEAVAATVLGPADAVQDSSWLDLPPAPASASQARRFVASHTAELPESALDAVLLLTSELVTNAVLHARTPIAVGVVVAESSVVVLVHDLDLTLPSQNPYPQREGGWGLRLVSAISESSGMVVHDTGGKTAWFRVRRDTLPDAVDSSAVRRDGEGRAS